MEIYLVGGAVRDELLGLPVTERDWVVVGSTPEEMLRLGYKPVGKDFPVFLHPQTHEEYALARTERKTGRGYKGFNFYASPEVALAEDLKRRDLTINAMAKDKEGHIIDPFFGKRDLKNKILRHVSPAFIEDPVRILRLARFAARFGEFMVDPETMRFMQAMVAEGEVEALVAERVWQEWFSALQMKKPQRFFEVLQDCQALAVLFPELQGNAQGFRAIKGAAERSMPVEIRFAVLLHRLDEQSLTRLCQRYRVPRALYELALMLVNYYSSYLQATSFNAEQILDLLHGLDAFRRPQRFEQYLSACEVIADQSSSSQLLNAAFNLAKSVSVEVFVSRGLQGQEIAHALREEQLTRMKHWISMLDKGR